jgi:hypothetical protein
MLPTALKNMARLITAQRQLRVLQLNHLTASPGTMETLFNAVKSQSTTLYEFSAAQMKFGRYPILETLASFRNLGHLTLADCSITVSDERAFRKSGWFCQLSWLDCRDTNLPDGVFEAIVTNAGKSLRILEVKHLTVEVANVVKNHNPNLHTMHVDILEFEALAVLRWHTSLELLRISEIQAPHLSSTEIMACLADWLPASLVRLTFERSSGVEAAALELFLGQCKAQIRELCFRQCLNFTDEHVYTVANFCNSALELLEVCDADLSHGAMSYAKQKIGRVVVTAS